MRRFSGAGKQFSTPDYYFSAPENYFSVADHNFRCGSGIVCSGIFITEDRGEAGASTIFFVIRTLSGATSYTEPTALAQR